MIILLCEDLQQEVFVRRFFKKMGSNEQIRVERSNRGEGAGVQFVIDHFPEELKKYRKYSYLTRPLIVMIDADDTTVADRIGKLEAKCRDHNIPFRDRKERGQRKKENPQVKKENVIIAVPQCNIETWIHYLEGNEVNETEDYKPVGRRKERDCDSAVEELVKLCRAKELNANAPESLKHACKEYRERMPS